ncbi:MAG: hypothetical protein MAGBODY4_01622 [Candidatus Marinimicrobia bacterium]|nr:hypothetical protein [Candidatus Neomarinimicrobiota bacterium]
MERERTHYIHVIQPSLHIIPPQSLGNPPHLLAPQIDMLLDFRLDCRLFFIDLCDNRIRLKHGIQQICKTTDELVFELRIFQ